MVSRGSHEESGGLRTGRPRRSQRRGDRTRRDCVAGRPGRNQRRPEKGRTAEPFPQNPEPFAEDPEPFAGDPEPFPEDPEPFPEDPKPFAEDPEPFAEDPEPFPEDPEPFAEDPEPFPEDPLGGARCTQSQSGLRPTPASQLPGPAARPLQPTLADGARPAPQL
ncbi:B1-hordein-like [Amphibalanus amphitrite]|uniref:B1-hordein-like n=1 Tax=Amphibalanus amphitrite TaxID=1232801 RepID=UPI001C90DE48|nr:B1-hordein-like [Amphibalanus amphitrite]